VTDIAYAAGGAGDGPVRNAGRATERAVGDPDRGRLAARDATLRALAPGDSLFGEDDSHGERELATFIW